jgi:peroxiredoxin
LVGFNNLQAELDALDIKVFAASVDSIDRASEVANDVYFPVGYGLTREQSEMVGAWHMSQRDAVQPSEFLLDASGKVVASSYSAGPIGRIDAADVIKLVKLYDSRR